MNRQLICVYMDFCASLESNIFPISNRKCLPFVYYENKLKLQILLVIFACLSGNV